MTEGQHIVGSLQPFDVNAGDWPAYTERLESYFIANDIKDEKKQVAVLLTLMGTLAYNLLRSIVAPTKPKDLKFKEVTTALEQHFHQRKVSFLNDSVSTSESKHPQEPDYISDYIAVLRKLSEHCKLRLLDTALRDRLVCGLSNENAQKLLLAEIDLTLKKAIEIAQAMEAADIQSKELRQASSGSLPPNAFGGEVKFLKGKARQPPARKQNGNERVPVPQVHTSRSAQDCWRCAGPHKPQTCRFKNEACNLCVKTAHIRRTCRMVKQFSGRAQYVDEARYDNAAVNYTENEQLEPEEENHYMMLGGINKIQMPAELNELSANMNPQKAINVFMEVNGKPITLELDTGACVTLVSEQTWKAKFESVNLSKTSLILKTYSGETLKVLGKTEAAVKLDGQESKLPLYVVEGNGPSLSGRNWLSTVKLNWGLIK